VEMEEKNSRIVILYGSQTGCAREVAERLARQSLAYSYAPVVASMNKYPRQNLPGEECVIFVASTTGQAEVPDNMKIFWRFLRRKDLPKNSLENLRFTVFGLGDSSYPIYNAVARRLYQRLLDLGAKAFHPRGLGDDQHDLGYDGALTPWAKKLWETLGKIRPVMGKSEYARSSSGSLPLLPPPFIVRIIQKGNPMKYDAEETDSHEEGSIHEKKKNRSSRACVTLTPDELKMFNSKDVMLGKVVQNKRMTSSGHFQDVRHIVFDFNDSNQSIEYTPGDVLNVYPQNSYKETVIAIKKCGLHPDDVLEITTNPNSPKFLVEAAAQGRVIPSRVRCLDLFRTYLDIFGTPSRYFFEVLSHFATDKMHRDKLLEFTSAEGQLDLYQYNNREKRTFVEVLSDFNSAKLPLSYLISLIPPIQIRQFSIASSCRKFPNQVHLCVAIVQYRTIFKRLKNGLCSSWLASLDPNQGPHLVPVSISKGSIRMPKDSSKPVIMIGPGTGIAPFVAMCQEREALLRTRKDDNLGSIYVFFGCRNQNGDFLFQQEWKSLLSGTMGAESENDGPEGKTKSKRQRIVPAVAGLYVAFSRDSNKKVYVQHKLAEQKELVWETLGKKKGYLLLAGNAKKMPNDVRKQIQEIVRVLGKLDEKTAKMFMLQMDSSRRYIQESWS